MNLRHEFGYRWFAMDAEALLGQFVREYSGILPANISREQVSEISNLLTDDLLMGSYVYAAIHPGGTYERTAIPGHPPQQCTGELYQLLSHHAFPDVSFAAKRFIGNDHVHQAGSGRVVSRDWEKNTICVRVVGMQYQLQTKVDIFRVNRTGYSGSLVIISVQENDTVEAKVLDERGGPFIPGDLIHMKRRSGDRKPMKDQ